MGVVRRGRRAERTRSGQGTPTPATQRSEQEERTRDTHSCHAVRPWTPATTIGERTPTCGPRSGRWRRNWRQRRPPLRREGRMERSEQGTPTPVHAEERTRDTHSCHAVRPWTPATTIGERTPTCGPRSGRWRRNWRQRRPPLRGEGRMVSRRSGQRRSYATPTRLEWVSPNRHASVVGRAGRHGGCPRWMSPVDVPRGCPRWMSPVDVLGGDGLRVARTTGTRAARPTIRPRPRPTPNWSPPYERPSHRNRGIDRAPDPQPSDPLPTR